MLPFQEACGHRRAAAPDSNHFVDAIAVQIGTGEAVRLPCLAVQLYFAFPCIGDALVRHVGKNVLPVGTSTEHQVRNAFAFFHKLDLSIALLEDVYALLRRKADFIADNDRPRRCRFDIVILLYRQPARKTRLHKLFPVQAIHVLAIAREADQRSIACAHAVKRDFRRRILLRKTFLHHRSIGNKERIAQGVEHLEGAVHRSDDQEFFAILFGMVDKDRATHGACKAHVTRELAAFNATVVDADRHADDRSREVHHAIAQEGVCGFFLAGVLRHVHRNLDTGVAALRRHRIRIAYRIDGLQRIELLLRILGGLAQVREQIRSRTVIVRILAEGILERLSNRKNPVGFNHRDTELVITQRIAAPEVCNAVFQSLAQVPFVHAPHRDTAGGPHRSCPCRQSGLSPFSC